MRFFLFGFRRYAVGLTGAKPVRAPNQAIDLIDDVEARVILAFPFQAPSIRMMTTAPPRSSEV
jgi:hypothetical protein